MPTDPGDTPSPLTEEERTRTLYEQLESHASQLGEFFSSVQIVCSNLEPDGATRRYHRGSGDYYARMGVVRDWLRAADRDTNKEQDEEE